ncbi:MAG: N-6 DNA methylase [Verrucomicrobiota bacterium]|jgi:type I restriction-modification system DNA methylase subunit
MLSVDALIKLLGYAESACFRTRESQFEPEAVQLFRFAKEKENSGDDFRVKGFYVLKTAAGKVAPLAARPAVCVAEAATTADARKLHRRIWNLGNVPFLMVRLPSEVRIYAGFHYDNSSDEAILSEKSSDEKILVTKLSDFSAASIDSARIWKAQRQHLDTQYRVDTTLLENLKHLAQALAKHCTPVLDLEVAHALIGKFVYLRYLRDRNILDDGWLKKRDINLAQVFGAAATVSELSRLVEALESRFNGDIFHINFGAKCPLTDSHVQLVASVFAGGDVRVDTMGYVHQLHLRFQAFDFRHIPVETLSSIYEQFLHGQKKGKSDGAYYTPEVLADYLLSEINSVRKLQPGMKVCDTACGSGIFLVLAYRRLIELELAATKKYSGSLDPVRLREILLESIYGVERQRDACNVTMFSLILTLLNYLDPPALHANEKFKFPALLNDRIYCDDFFNPGLKLPVPKGGFDVIIGNPPWIELKPETKEEDHARKWIARERMIAGNRVADAFAVKAGRLLGSDGVAGLLLPATTLFNLEGKSFRQAFFTEFAVARVTNFANLRGNLFGKRAILPTTTLVFAKSDETRSTKPIIHHGPFAANQVAANAEELWVLTIHGSEIQPISQSDAATGETSVWKLALWGTPRDARSLDRLRQLYPLTLARFCERRGWGKKMPRQGAELRDITKVKKGKNNKPKENLVYCNELKGKKRFDPDKFNQLVKGGLHFSIPKQTLKDITNDECYVRERGGLSGLEINKPPHLLIPASWKNFLLFSDEYFAIPPRQIGIAAATSEDSETLRAVTVYLASSLVDYFVFFQVPEWGVYSTYPIVVLRAVRAIPTPDFSDDQVKALTKVHREILQEEKTFRLKSEDASGIIEKQRLIDESIFDVLGIPDDVRVLVEDFRDNRLPLDNGVSALRKLGKFPNTKELQAYGRALRDELERFLLGEAHPCVRIITTEDLICCELQLLPASSTASQAIEVLDAGENSNGKAAHRKLREMLSEKFSQWAYIDRSLRVFEEDTVQVFKSPRLMDWTRTQALNDADAIIAEILADGEMPA